MMRIHPGAGIGAFARVAARVRPAVAADLPEIAEIYAHHVRHGRATLETEPPDLEEVARRWSEVLARGLPWLALEADGAVLGYAYAGPYRMRPGYRFTVEDSVYLDPAATGLGLGRRLLEALVHDCTARGLQRMVAVIGDAANRASIRLHEALGFERAGVLRGIGFKHGAWLDQMLMQRMLAPAGPPAA